MVTQEEETERDKERAAAVLRQDSTPNLNPQRQGEKERQSKIETVIFV